MTCIKPAAPAALQSPAVNGVPSLSVLDGWWLEGCAEGVTGWAVGADGPDDSGPDALSLYAKLEERAEALAAGAAARGRARWKSPLRLRQVHAAARPPP